MWSIATPIGRNGPMPDRVVMWNARRIGGLIAADQWIWLERARDGAFFMSLSTNTSDIVDIFTDDYELEQI